MFPLQENRTLNRSRPLFAVSIGNEVRVPWQSYRGFAASHACLFGNSLAIGPSRTGIFRRRQHTLPWLDCANFSGRRVACESKASQPTRTASTEFFVSLSQRELAILFSRVHHQEFPTDVTAYGRGCGVGRGRGVTGAGRKVVKDAEKPRPKSFPKIVAT